MAEWLTNLNGKIFSSSRERLKFETTCMLNEHYSAYFLVCTGCYLLRGHHNIRWDILLFLVPLVITFKHEVEGGGAKLRSTWYYLPCVPICHMVAWASLFFMMFTKSVRMLGQWHWGRAGEWVLMLFTYFWRYLVDPINYTPPFHVTTLVQVTWPLFFTACCINRAVPNFFRDKRKKGTLVSGLHRWFLHQLLATLIAQVFHGLAKFYITPIYKMEDFPTYMQYTELPVMFMFCYFMFLGMCQVSFVGGGEVFFYHQHKYWHDTQLLYGAVHKSHHLKKDTCFLEGNLGGILESSFIFNYAPIATSPKMWWFLASAGVIRDMLYHQYEDGCWSQIMPDDGCIITREGMKLWSHHVHHKYYQEPYSVGDAFSQIEKPDMEKKGVIPVQPAETQGPVGVKFVPPGTEGYVPATAKTEDKKDS